VEIDNFDALEPLLEFPEGKDWLYFLLLLRRRKDNPEMKGDNQVVDTQYIYSLDSYRSREVRIKAVCNATRCRACLFPSALSAKVVALESLTVLAEQIKKETYHLAHRAYGSAAGRCAPVQHRWVVDLDHKDGDVTELKANILNALLLDVRPLNVVPVAEIQTPGGIHLITPRFDLQRFGVLFPGVKVHKHNPTVLYAPDFS